MRGGDEEVLRAGLSGGRGQGAAGGVCELGIQRHAEATAGQKQYCMFKIA